MRFLSLALAAALTLIGCSSNDDAPDCTTGTSRAFVITALGFTRESPRGVAAGFDLDSKVTTEPENESCGKLDLLGPNGEQGVDNQLALFIPEIEKRFGNAVDGIIQGAINDGRLLIMFDLAGVDDVRDDRCVNMEVKLAEGQPALGTDGVVEAWQTFDLRKEGQKVSSATGGKFEKHTFTIGPFPLHIPIAIFDVSFMIHLRDARIRFTIDDEGNIEGLLGGGVNFDEIADGVQNGAGLADIIPQLRFLGRAASDLGYDSNEGVCRLLSASLAFKARPAFLRK